MKDLKNKQKGTQTWKSINENLEMSLLLPLFSQQLNLQIVKTKLMKTINKEENTNLLAEHANFAAKSNN